MRLYNIANNNQVVVIEGVRTLFSYGVAIAQNNTVNNTISLDAKKWNYSKTTGKHRNTFLHETKRETQAKIDNGTYILTDLN